MQNKSGLLVIVGIIGALFYGGYYFYLTGDGRLLIANDSLSLIGATLVLTLDLGIILYCLVLVIFNRAELSVFVVAFLAVIALNTYLVRENPLRSIKARMDEYTNISGLHQGSDGAYITGKVLAVDRSRNTTDDLYFQLPNDLRATIPEEVGTVIWVECGSRVVGTYTDGGKAHQITCELTIIDMANTTIVGVKSFTGGPPPGSKRSGTGNEVGSRPTKEMAEYIMTFPKR
jgi:hypothetical protein